MTRRNRGLRTVAALALGMLAVTACDNGLTEVNENPNAPESVPLNNVLLKGIWDLSNNGGNRGYHGRWVMLQHSTNWAQHLAQPVYNDEDQYIPRPTIQDDVWDEMYAALTDLADAKRLADAAGDDNAWAVAEVMTVFGFAMLTDIFGDIPYTEALRLTDPDNPVSAPNYDAQADIYADLIARLTAAAGMFDSGAFIGWDDFDPVYAGDVDGWEMFANSLRLRLAMRVGNQAAFEAAWASNIFASVDDQADIDWVGEYPSANPTWLALIYGGRSGDFRMSESLVDRLADFNDPRLEVYADPAVSDSQYRGLRNGLLPSEYVPALGAADFSTIGSYFLQPGTPSNLLSYAEVLFLGAEAAELGWNVGGATANDLYEDAITASMEDVGIDGADITAYLAQADVGLTTGTYQGLDAIRVQKWIALFQAGIESWSDLRRYGWDWTTDAGTTGADLVPSENSVLGAGEFPARYPSPQSEELYNENAPEASTITDPVWWAM